MLRIYLSQNELNDKVGVVGNYYARVDNMPPIGIEELAELIHEHNIGQSTGTIFGILKDAVTIIRSQVLMGQPVKIDNLAIFKASVENRGGWASLKDVSLHIGGQNDNIQAIRLLAQATGDFTKSELSKDGRLVLDRESARMVAAAGGNADGSGDSGSSGSDDSGSGTSAGPVLTITKTGSGTASVTDQTDHQVDSGSEVAAGTTLTLTVTAGGAAAPTATLDGTAITLVEDEGAYTGVFQMPAASATLTVSTGA